uniref:Protein FAM65C-like protein n=1 Tax=Callorhinchus milii TaxID=7868 RepID=V9KHQ9_CALMI
MKGLMTVLVGTVTCESADFFTAQPQIMIVDITELGTIKLQLEVMWNPFDTDELSAMSGSVNKYSVSSRKGSLYNWTPPSTPSFRDKYFPQYFGQEDTLPPLYQETKGTSIFNYLGNGNQNTHLSSVPENEKCHSYTNVESEENSRCVEGSSGIQGSTSELSSGTQEDIPSVQPADSPQTQPDSPNQKQLQLDWTQAVSSVLPESALHVGPQPSQQLSRGKPPALGSTDHINTHILNQLTPTLPSTHGNGTLVPPEKSARADFVSVNIGAILQEILMFLRTVQIRYKELQRLEQQLLHFRDILKESTSSRSESTVSLSVETALESFDFLNVDINEDTLSCSGSVRIKDERNSTYTEPSLCHHDLSSKNGDSGTKRKQILALTSENHYLDQTLLTHLQICRRLLQRFTSIGSTLQNSILEELSQQILVFETLAVMCHGKTGNVRSVEEVIPKAQKVKLLSSFWRKCAGTECVLYSSTERFLTQLRNYYTQKVNAKCLGLSERVFRTLLHQIAGCCGFLLSASLSEEVLTIFQFFNYVKRHSITDLGTHLMKLTKEVSLAEALQTTQKIKTLKKLKGKHITEFQPLHQTLESISILQLDENPKVIQAAKSFLSNASVHRHFRDKALAHYTDALQDKDLQIQKSACMALKHLKAVESIEQIVSLCQSETKDVRDTARETILSFGEKGHLAFEKLEKMWYDLEEDRIQNETTQITIL